MQVLSTSSPGAFHVCLQDKTWDLLTAAISGCKSLGIRYYHVHDESIR